jgi:uncharacterized membrane protein
MEKETARIEAFSDGVFAIAITLLILEIKVPGPSAHLGSQLLKQWPSYVAFLISFAFIGIMWINHHRLFTHIKRSDNMLLLLGVTSVPYPTAVLAQHLGQPDQVIAALVYNGLYFVIAIFFNVLWWYVNRGNLLGRDADLASAEKISKQYAVGPSLYLVCFALTWISVGGSLVLNFALAIYFALPPHVVSEKRRKLTAITR